MDLGDKTEVIGDDDDVVVGNRCGAGGIFNSGGAVWLALDAVVKVKVSDGDGENDGNVVLNAAADEEEPLGKVGSVEIVDEITLCGEREPTVSFGKCVLLEVAGRTVDDVATATFWTAVSDDADSAAYEIFSDPGYSSESDKKQTGLISCKLIKYYCKRTKDFNFDYKYYVTDRIDS